MPASIIVDKDSDEFFIAICEFGEHSYVTVGVKQASKQVRLLGGFGKTNKGSNSFCSALLTQDAAFIQNEQILVNDDAEGRPLPPGRKEIGYKAYSIKYNQYLQFLAHMAAISKAQNQSMRRSTIPKTLRVLNAFRPEEEEGNQVQLELRTLDDQTLNQREVSPEEFNLRFFGNSCRHTSIRLVESARETPDLGEGVSSLFFRSLPLTVVFGHGMVQKGHHFYILPLPPTAFPNIEGNHKSFLEQLYNRLDKMVLIAQDDKTSIVKFERLKALYKEIAGKSPGNILEVIDAIETWEVGNHDLIDVHRSWNLFWNRTATRKMFDEFSEQFSNIQQPDSYVT